MCANELVFMPSQKPISVLNGPNSEQHICLLFNAITAHYSKLKIILTWYGPFKIHMETGGPFKLLGSCCVENTVGFCLCGNTCNTLHHHYECSTSNKETQDFRSSTLITLCLAPPSHTVKKSFSLVCFLNEVQYRAINLDRAYLHTAVCKGLNNIVEFLS